MKANGTKYLDRFRLRTPTTSNIPPMVEMLQRMPAGGCAHPDPYHRPVCELYGTIGSGGVIAWKEQDFFTFTRRIIGNLFRKPATVGYPYEPVEYPERMRGHVEINIEDCITCGLCAAVLSVAGNPGGPEGGNMDNQPV